MRQRFERRAAHAGFAAVALPSRDRKIIEAGRIGGPGEGLDLAPLGAPAVFDLGECGAASALYREQPQLNRFRVSSSDLSREFNIGLLRSPAARNHAMDAASLDRQNQCAESEGFENRLSRRSRGKRSCDSPRRRFLQLTAGAAALPAVSRSASAQAYPTRPITIVVAYAAGGTTDIISRVLAERMRMTLGQAVVVENVTGAGGRSAPPGPRARRPTATRSV